MRDKFTSLTRTLLLMASLFVGATAYADEGTTDTDFDYSPPEEIGVFDQFTEFFADMFRTPSHAGSYSTAKKRLYRKIEDEQTLYCGCPTNLTERTFDETSCGYEPRNDNVRAHRLEAEHVLPAFWIANFHTGTSCWVADSTCGGARECCLKNDARFKKAHNDLVNLMPSVGELNADRSNFIFDLISGEERDYGDCDFEADSGKRTTEPKVDIRGDIARVYFYMRDTYDLAYPVGLSDRLDDWNSADPISDQEKERNKRIEDTQGTANTLIAH